MSGAAPPPAEPVVRPRGHRISLVWLVPIVALLVAGYLGYRTLSERGPLITLTFRDAAGLTAGQTPVRYKSVQVGLVEGIALSDDLQQVRVSVRMNREVDGRLTDRAQFWVVRPRLTAGNVSGLETIVSGAYIEFDPGLERGASRREFTGLENPPGIRSDEPGRVFTLLAQRIGSLDRGSPVFFRDVVVGEILDYEPPGLDGGITLRAFIRSPFDGYLKEGSRFWNSSGVNLRLGGNGVQLELESLRAVLSGGVAFDTPVELRNDPPAPDTARFQLYDDLDAAVSATTKDRLVFLLYFDGSVRGLSPGAPVEMRGIRIGSVLDRALEYDEPSDSFRLPVHIAIEPDRIAYPKGRAGRTQEDVVAFARRMVERGMRARLMSGSLVTGQMVVSLDFVDNAPPAEVVMQGEDVILPTLPGSDLMGTVGGLAARLQEIPLAEIGRNLNATLAGVNGLVNAPAVRGAVQGLASAVEEVQGLLKRADEGFAPLLRRLPSMAQILEQALGRANTAVGSIERGYGNDSEINRQLARTLSQVNDAARSIRLLADSLDRHPEALIRGRTDRGNTP